MPNIGAMFKQEIVRLARKEIRTHVDPLRKASVEFRRLNAVLRKQVAVLERQVARLSKQAQARPAEAATEPLKLRFVAKGLRSHRARLGLSAADFGKLVGVTAQSIYNWEQGHATPRNEQLASIAALRKIGKREALQRIEAVAGTGAPAARAARGKVAPDKAASGKAAPKAKKAARDGVAAPKRSRGETKPKKNETPAKTTRRNRSAGKASSTAKSATPANTASGAAATDTR